MKFKTVYAFVLIFALNLSINAQQDPICPNQFSPYPESPEYNNWNTEYDFGALNPWYIVTDAFVDAILPNPIPYEYIIETISKGESDGGEIAKEVVSLERSMLAVVVIGLLLAFIVPLVGCCVCCCRIFKCCGWIRCCWMCCHRCGGDRLWDYKKDLKFKKKRMILKCCILSTLTVCIIVSVISGTVVAYVTNQRVRESVFQAPDMLKAALSDVAIYMNYLNREIEFITVNQFQNTAQCITSAIATSPERLQSVINDEYNITELFDSLYALEKDYNNIKKELLSLQTVLNEIVMIENRLTERIKDLNNNLDLLSMSCGIAGLDCSLVPPRISLNISENDYGITSAVNTVIVELGSYNFSQLIVETNTFVESAIDDFSSTVEDQSNVVMEQLQMSVQGHLNATAREVSQVIEDININILNVQQQIDIVNTVISTSAGSQTILWIANETRFGLGILLCLIINLILLCSLCGIGCGAVGYIEGPAYPPGRHKCSNCGGYCLLIASCNIFFWWFFLMMSIIAALFLSTHFDLICNEIEHPDYNVLSKLIEDPDFLNSSLGFNSNFTKLVEDGFSLKKILLDCSENKGIYKAAQFDKVLATLGQIDIDSTFSDSTKTINDLEQKVIMSINETTSNPIILIDNNTTLELQNLQNLSINDANVTGYISQYNYIIVSWNISSSKESIDKMQEDCAGACDSREVLDNVDALYVNIVADTDNIQRQFTLLSRQYASALELAKRITVTVEELLEAADRVSIQISNTSKVMESASRYISSEFDVGYDYVAYVQDTLENEVGKCYAPWRAFRGTEQLICGGIVESLNAFWFALGWCMFCLLPLVFCMLWLSYYLMRFKEQKIQSGSPYRHQTGLESDYNEPSIIVNTEEGMEMYITEEQTGGTANPMDQSESNSTVAPPIVGQERSSDGPTNEDIADNARVQFDERAKSVVYTNKVSLSETEDWQRFAPPPDYFAMYPRELAENGNGPRIYTASLHRDVRQTDFD